MADPTSQMGEVKRLRSVSRPKDRMTLAEVNTPHTERRSLQGNLGSLRSNMHVFQASVTEYFENGS